MGRTSTPYAGAFFAMVGIGGVVGAVTPLVLTMIEVFATASIDLPGLMIRSVLGFFMGLVLAGSGAGPAVGLHALAERKAPQLRVPAAVFGAVLGPVVLTAAVVGWPWQFPGMPAVWTLVLIASAAIAVRVTRPLRSREKQEGDPVLGRTA